MTISIEKNDSNWDENLHAQTYLYAFDLVEQFLNEFLLGKLGIDKAMAMEIFLERRGLGKKLDVSDS